MSRYQSVWNAIKKTGRAEFTVHKDIAPTVIQGIKVTKSAENVARRKVGFVGWSKLVIKEERISEHHVKVTMTLLYDTNL